MVAGFFSEQEAPWRPVARIRKVKNFLPGTVVKVDFPNLIETGEGVPISEGYPQDAKQGFQIATHARTISIGRQALFSDDLGALSSAAEAAAIGTARTISDSVFAKLLANPVMSEDSVALFGSHTSGSNTVAATLDADGLASVIALIRNQKGLSRAGETGPATNLRPFAVLVPPALEGKARNVVGNFGEASDLQVLVEPRLTSATTFYCIAAGPGLEIQSLNDDLAPSVSQFSGSSVLGMAWNIILDFGISFIEHRTWSRGT